jgi:hypothetical protein
MARATQAITVEATGVPALGMGVPFVATMYRTGLASLRPKGGALGALFAERTAQQEIDAATERIEALPFQMQYLERAVARHRAFAETGQAAQLALAIEDVRAAMAAPSQLIDADVTGLLLAVMYQSELLHLRDGVDGVEAAAREAARDGVLGAARDLLARPAAGPVLYRWLVQRAADAGDGALEMQVALRWTAEAPDDGAAHLALGSAEYRAGGYNRAYLCAARALDLGVADAAAAEELRRSAWANLGAVGVPEAAVFKREGEALPAERGR